MLQVTEREMENRLRPDNPWWEAGAGIDPEYHTFPGGKDHPRVPRDPCMATTLSREGVQAVGAVEIEYSPVSLHCYTVGKNTLERARG
jgi:hypothetical protein